MAQIRSRLWVVVGLLATLAALAGGGHAQGPPKGNSYSSTVNGHKFLGASRVNIRDLSDEEAPAKTAKMQLDQNAISLNNFGDPGVTTLVAYPYKDIKLTKVNVKDAANQGRLLYDVEFVDQKDAVKEKIRLVWSPSTKDSFSSVRLLLLNDKNNVTEMLELRQGK